MLRKILVAFATDYGSTQEIAEAIAMQLRKHALDVDILPMRSVRDLSEYQTIVMGAPLYMFHWHKDAHSLLSHHRKSLEKLPVAIFALGPFNDIEEEWKGAREQIDKELAKYPWLTPVDLKIFGGKFDPTKLHFPYSLLPALKNIPASDIRDWTAIRGWADELTVRFLSA